jgi:hypothetical protein
MDGQHRSVWLGLLGEGGDCQERGSDEREGSGMTHF